VDVRGVQRWHIGDPAQPARPPAVVRYPAAGTPNAAIDLALVDLAGNTTPVRWDAATYPYLVDAVWSGDGPPVVAVQTRDQRRLAYLAVDPGDGGTQPLIEETDDHWVQIVAGVPRWSRGRLVTCTDRDDVRRLAVDGQAVGPAGLAIRTVVDVGPETAVVTAWEHDDPTVVGVWRVALSGDAAERLSPPGAVTEAAAGGDVVVLQSRSLDDAGVSTFAVSPRLRIEIASHAETPLVRPAPRLARSGARRLATALLLPEDHDGPLPVLLDPYGGPHPEMLRVRRASAAFLVSQWFAEQGFAVLVTDGRGCAGRGSAWERAVAGDLASGPLEDQVDALEAVAAANPGLLDLGRVAIRGWSFGGFLAALAVLRRPDVFAAAVAGAPVTDWRLYDTHYTERYLGHPDVDPDAYRRSSLLEDAPRLRRPLLLVHGLADDNVVAAHTLRLSAALLAAGRPHEVLPLVEVTHMTPQEQVAENLLWAELDFLQRALGLPRRTAAAGGDAA
jgi:dipeptidyl-peptidase 4